MNPRFPVYIVSKGRYETAITMRHLDRMAVPYYVVVEEAEFAAYAAALGADKLLVLDPSYQERYETCDELGAERSRGPGPARNFAWDHAVASGAEWHWVMDDNIKGFFRLNRNLKTPVSDGTILRCMEDFVLRYKNVGEAGPNYFMFASRKSAMAPFALNTRIYSCNLIRNDIPFRWRGRYNEDTDLALRMLKAGWCTVQFNAFLQYKLPTQTVPGGNTDEFYKKEGTLPKSRMVVKLHPDVCRLVWRFGRWHHYADYYRFKQRLAPREDLERDGAADEYGMRLVQLPLTPAQRRRGRAAIATLLAAFLALPVLARAESASSYAPGQTGGASPGQESGTGSAKACAPGQLKKSDGTCSAATTTPPTSAPPATTPTAPTPSAPSTPLAPTPSQSTPLGSIGQALGGATAPALSPQPLPAPTPTPAPNPTPLTLIPTFPAAPAQPSPPPSPTVLEYSPALGIPVNYPQNPPPPSAAVGTRGNPFRGLGVNSEAGGSETTPASLWTYTSATTGFYWGGCPEYYANGRWWYY